VAILAKATTITGTDHNRGISTRIIKIKVVLAWVLVTSETLTQDSRQDTIKAIMVINSMTIAAATMDVAEDGAAATTALVAMDEADINSTVGMQATRTSRAKAARMAKRKLKPLLVTLSNLMPNLTGMRRGRQREASKVGRWRAQKATPVHLVKLQASLRQMEGRRPQTSSLLAVPVLPTDLLVPYALCCRSQMSPSTRPLALRQCGKACRILAFITYVLEDSRLVTKLLQDPRLRRLRNSRLRTGLGLEVILAIVKAEKATVTTESAPRSSPTSMKGEMGKRMTGKVNGLMSDVREQHLPAGVAVVVEVRKTHAAVSDTNPPPRRTTHTMMSINARGIEAESMRMTMSTDPEKAGRTSRQDRCRQPDLRDLVAEAGEIVTTTSAGIEKETVTEIGTEIGTGTGIAIVTETETGTGIETETKTHIVMMTIRSLVIDPIATTRARDDVIRIENATETAKIGKNETGPRTKTTGIAETEKTLDMVASASARAGSSQSTYPTTPRTGTRNSSRPLVRGVRALECLTIRVVADPTLRQKTYTHSSARHATANGCSRKRSVSRGWPGWQDPSEAAMRLTMARVAGARAAEEADAVKRATAATRSSACEDLRLNARPVDGVDPHLYIHAPSPLPAMRSNRRRRNKVGKVAAKKQEPPLILGWAGNKMTLLAGNHNTILHVRSSRYLSELSEGTIFGVICTKTGGSLGKSVPPKMEERNTTFELARFCIMEKEALKVE
jgi:hypothetical protein